jgi:hypothetical protein
MTVKGSGYYCQKIRPVQRERSKTNDIG